MTDLLILFGTTEGQTAKIARWLAERARARGLEPDLRDAAGLPADFDPSRYAAAIVAASIHVSRHQASVEHFIRDHLAALNAMPTAFISVSLSAAGDEHDRQDAQECADGLLRQTGWRPSRTHLVAGALRFTRYDFFKRWIMRRIARKKGAPTDTSHDWEFTDWDDLNRFLDSFLKEVYER